MTTKKQDWSVEIQPHPSAANLINVKMQSTTEDGAKIKVEVPVNSLSGSVEVMKTNAEFIGAPWEPSKPDDGA